jgi:hypothetical protein
MPIVTLGMTNLIRDVATVLGAILVTIVISELLIVVIRRGFG